MRQNETNIFICNIFSNASAKGTCLSLNKTRYHVEYHLLMHVKRYQPSEARQKLLSWLSVTYKVISSIKLSFLVKFLLYVATVSMVHKY